MTDPGGREAEIEAMRCKHSDVRCAEHDGRRAIACFVCGRLFCNLTDDDYAVAYNPPTRSPQSEDHDA